MWYVDKIQDATEWLNPFKMENGDIVNAAMFDSERDAWRHLASQLEDQVSHLQGRLTNARLKASSLTPEPHEL